MSVYSFNSFSAKSHLVCVSLVVLRILCKKSRCFFGKIYTGGKHFTRRPVVTVATNLNPERDPYST